MSKSIVYALIGLVIGLGAFFIWQEAHAPGSLNPDLYPLYTGAQWGPVKSSTVDGAVGYEVESNPITNITNIVASSTPFYDYYKTKLTQAGWTQDMAREAGGPGSEVSVFTKEAQFIIISFKTTFHTKPTNAPEQCPCDLVFMLISGTTR